jgi:signal transduction histidine kinase
MSKRVSKKLINQFNFPDNSVGWFELSIQPVEEGVIVLSFDMTEQKKIEYELTNRIKEKQELIDLIKTQNKKLEDFCQIIAHDLRGPIINLELISNMIKETDDVNEKMVYLRKQEPIVGYLHNILEDLIETTQINSNINNDNVEEIDLKEKCNEILESLQGEISKVNASISLDFDEVPKIRYDKIYLNSILYNLICNSIKYSKPDTTLFLKIRSYLKANWVYIELIDNGIGIDLERYGDQIFKFRKVFHDHPNSKGIGLFMTKERIEASGGNIMLKSKPNEGTTIIIKLTERK